MRPQLLILVLLGFVACRHSPEQLPPWNPPLAWTPGASETGVESDPKPLPESAEDTLSEQQRAALQEVRARPVTVEIPARFDRFPAKREVYTNWFLRGYTFTRATGLRHHHSGFYHGQKVTADRLPMIRGWIDGQCQADIEFIGSGMKR